METVLSIIYNVGILFIMMIPGILMKKCRLCSDGFGKGISNLVLYIAQPALIFLAYLKEFSTEVLINSLIVLLLSVIAHVIFLLALLFYKRQVRTDAECSALRPYSPTPPLWVYHL